MPRRRRRRAIGILPRDLLPDIFRGRGAAPLRARRRPRRRLPPWLSEQHGRQQTGLPRRNNECEPTTYPYPPLWTCRNQWGLCSGRGPAISNSERLAIQANRFSFGRARGGAARHRPRQVEKLDIKYIAFLGSCKGRDSRCHGSRPRHPWPFRAARKAPPARPLAHDVPDFHRRINVPPALRTSWVSGVADLEFAF